jgi:uncharacterized membrane protein
MNNLTAYFKKKAQLYLNKKDNRYDIIFFTLLITVILFFSYRVIYRPFWEDEFFTASLVNEGFLSREFWKTVFEDVHPPLYYLLLDIWRQIEGGTFLGFRYFSVLVFALSTFVLYKISGFLSTAKDFRYLTVFLYVISPVFLNYATEARMYMLLSFFVLCSFYFFLKILSKKDNTLFTKKDYLNGLTSGLFLAFSFLVHYFGMLTAPAFALVAVYKYRKKILEKDIIKLLLTVFTPLVFSFLLWFPILFSQYKNSMEKVSWIYEASIFGLFSAFNVILYDPKIDLFNLIVSPPLVFIPFLIFLVLVGLGYKKIKGNQTINIFLIFSWTPIILIFLLSKFTDLEFYILRYFLPFSAVFLIVYLWVFYKILPKYLFYLLAAVYTLIIFEQMWFELLLSMTVGLLK